MKPTALKFLAIVILLILSISLNAQTLYVNVTQGKDDAPGTQNEPLASLEEAVVKANTFSGKEPVTIKVAPGLYTIISALAIHQKSNQQAAAKYTFEAMVMPGDTAWTPAKMPVIQCVADSNRIGKLKHACSAFQIARNHVVIKGLKFIGNPNPASEYYYAIERRDSTLTGLEISQCYFIGEKNSAPIQGGVFAQGAGISVDHCIFYGVKNAVMVFLGIRNFSLTHSIIYGAYEGAVWYGYGQSSNMPFIFSDNIITNCDYFWIGYQGVHTNYKFTNSIISQNAFYLGFNGDDVKPDLLNKPLEQNIQKNEKITLSEVKTKGVPKDYLNLSSSLQGIHIDAGIFIK